MKSRLFHYFSFLCICLMPLPVWAQSDIRITADVSQKLITVGTSIEYVIKIESNSRPPSLDRLRMPKPPVFKGLQPVPGAPATSQQSVISNNRLIATVSLAWQLQAAEPGEASISSATITYDGRSHELPGFVVKVVSDPQDTIPQAVRDLGVLPPFSGNAEVDRQLKGHVFARLSFSDPQPWLMQPVVVECTLFLDQYENLIRGVDWEAPKWQAFFAEEAEVQRSFRPVEIGGRRYQALTIKRFLLSPTGAGRIEIPASQAVCGIRVQRRSSFENRFFGPGFNSLLDDQIPIRLPIAARTIDVRPLPVEGRPASFQNAVGQFSFAASVDRKQMTTDDILTLSLEVAGEGFLGSLDDPEFPKWKDWREAGKQAETTPGSSSFSGKKTFEILLRPEKSGALTIPEIRYAWFDPEQERYVEEMGGPFAVEVTPGKEHELIVVGPAGQGRDAASPRFFGEQIAYIHPVLPSATSWTPLYERPWFWPLQTIPLLIILCGLAMRFWRLYIEDHQDERRWRSAGSRARKELREAGASLHRGHTEEFYSVLGQALRDYIAVKLDRSASGLTLEEIAQTCRNRDVPEEKTATFIRLLEECDQARYLSVKPDPARAREALGEAARWLKELDRHL